MHTPLLTNAPTNRQIHGSGAAIGNFRLITKSKELEGEQLLVKLHTLFAENGGDQKSVGSEQADGTWNQPWARAHQTVSGQSIVRHADVSYKRLTRSFIFLLSFLFSFFFVRRNAIDRREACFVSLYLRYESIPLFRFEEKGKMSFREGRIERIEGEREREMVKIGKRTK